MDQAALQRIDWVRRMIHVEMYEQDGETLSGPAFCGQFPVGADAVGASAWHDEPHIIQRATCPQCLLRLFMLGDSAQIALAKMGMEIDVHNAGAQMINNDGSEIS